MTVDRREKALYHQIHPVKLLTDVSTSLISLYFFWENSLGYGLLFGVFPSIVVSAVLVRFIGLEELKSSRFGTYVGRYMTGSMQAVRFLGQLIVWAGAWYHFVPVVALGFLTILFGWARGRILP